MNSFQKNVILDIRKLIKSVDCAYGIVRILLLVSTFIYFSVFLAEFANGSDEVMPGDIYYLYVLLLLLHFMFKVLRQTLRRTRDIYLDKGGVLCSVDTTTTEDTTKKAMTKKKSERYLWSIKASFAIYPPSGLSKHILALWCTLAIIIPLMFIFKSNIEMPENFLTIMLWIFGSSILGALNNGWLISQLPKLLDIAVKVASVTANATGNSKVADVAYAVGEALNDNTDDARKKNKRK